MVSLIGEQPDAKSYVAQMQKAMSQAERNEHEYRTYAARVGKQKKQHEQWKIADVEIEARSGWLNTYESVEYIITDDWKSIKVRHPESGEIEIFNDCAYISIRKSKMLCARR